MNLPRKPTSLAELYSYHPDPAAKRDPRFQRNNPMNGNGYEPTLSPAANLYEQQPIPIPVAGMTVIPGAQQSVMQPRGLNAPGNPALGLQNPGIGDISTTQLPMGFPVPQPQRGMSTSVGNRGSRNVPRPPG